MSLTRISRVSNLPNSLENTLKFSKVVELSNALSLGDVKSKEKQFNPVAAISPDQKYCHVIRNNASDTSYIKKIPSNVVFTSLKDTSDYLNYKSSPVTKQLEYTAGSVEYAIQHNNSSVLNSMLNNDEFDINQKISIKNETRKLSLLDFAAHCGSLDCFKLLKDTNLLITDDTLKHAVIGGDLDILHICNERVGKVSKFLNFAVEICQNDVADWIMKQTGNTNINIWSSLKNHNIEAIYYCITHGSAYLDKKKYIDDSPFHSAVQKGYKDVVKIFLLHGASVKSTSRSLSSLHDAAMFGHRDICEILIKNGADVNVRDMDYCTPLYYATYFGHEDIIRLLLENGATNDIFPAQIQAPPRPSTISRPTPNYVKAVPYTTNFQSLSEVQQFIGYKSQPVIRKHSLQPGTIQDVIQRDDVTTLEKFLEDPKFNKDQVFKLDDEKGQYPLLDLAAYFGASKCFNYLIDKKGFTIADKTSKRAIIGGNFDILARCQRENGKVGVYINSAVQMCRNDVIDWILKNCKEHSEVSFYSAIHYHNIEAIYYCLSHKEITPVDEEEELETSIQFVRNKFNPLQLAIQDGNKDVCEILLKNGANVNEKFLKDETALHTACRVGNTEIVELLLQNHAILHVLNDNLHSPMYLALERDLYEICQLLIKRGQDVNESNGLTYSEKTLLHVACQRGFTDLAELLIHHGARVDAKTLYGHTPLHLAAMEGQDKVVSMLIGKGADINAKNHKGNTPLYYAQLRNRVKICDILKKNGAENVPPPRHERTGGRFCTI